MPWTSLQKLILAAALSFGSFACDTPVGGGCEYTSYPGTCTVNASGGFDFSGTINGETVILRENVFTSAPSRATGDTLTCELMMISAGTCTPCLFDVGEAGAEAWSACNGR